MKEQKAERLRLLQTAVLEL